VTIRVLACCEHFAQLQSLGFSRLQIRLEQLIALDMYCLETGSRRPGIRIIREMLARGLTLIRLDDLAPFVLFLVVLIDKAALAAANNAEALGVPTNDGFVVRQITGLCAGGEAKDSQY